MNKIIIAIGRSEDMYGAYAENCEGIYGEGETVEEVKADIYEAIRLIKKNLPEDQWPEPIKDDFEIQWKFDVQSLLNHFQGIFTNAALERLTGINQKQLWNYANGISKPRKQAKEKIQKALNSLGAELSTISL